MNMTRWIPGKVALLFCSLLFSNQVWAEGPEAIPLGVPDVVVGRRSTDGSVQETFRQAIKLVEGVTELELPTQLSREQWRQLEAVGFSPKPALVFRAYQNPSAQDIENLAGADAWVTFKPMGNNEYSVDGQINLTRLANNGLLTNTLVKALLSSDLPDDEKREVYALRQQSQRVALQIQSGLLSLADPYAEVEVMTRIAFDLTGVSIDVRTASKGWWGNLWEGIKDTVDCYLSALQEFVAGHDSVTWEVTCGTTGCSVTLGGTVSGAAAAHFLGSLKGCM